MTHELTSGTAVILYLSHEQCNVCKVLKPKVKELLESKYPECQLKYVDIIEHPDIAAQLQVFAAPTILVYFEGKEYFRFSRNIGLQQVDEAINRPYQLMFG